MSTIRTITPASGQSLITLAQVKLYLSETGSTKDALYTALISSASSSMIAFLGVHPGRQRYEEVSRGLHGGLVSRYLSRLPVEEGSLSITLDSVALTAATVFPLTDNDHFILEDPDWGLVYRPSGWYSGSLSSPSTSPGLIDRYHAGYLLPDQVSTWTASTTFTVGKFVRATTPSLLRFEATAITTGITDAAEPTWPTAIAGTVVDGGVTWTARAARELPEHISLHCYSEVLRAIGNLDVAPGVASWEVEGVSESRFATQTDRALAPSTRDALLSFRKELGVVGVS